MTKKIKSFLWLCLGLFIIGNGASLLVYSNLGSDPFNIMSQGMAGIFGIQVGTSNIIIQLVLLLAAALRKSRHIGIGSIMGTFIVGNVMNLWALLIEPVLSHTYIGIRLVCICLAPIIIGLGVAIVQTSRMGLVPNDIAPLLLHDAMPKFQYRSVRIGYDISHIVIGVILGGLIGLGTITSAVFTGPAIQFFLTLKEKEKQLVAECSKCS